jgi:hypothetical protein
VDLDRPGAGFIEVSQQPMFDTAASLAAFPDEVAVGLWPPAALRGLAEDRIDAFDEEIKRMRTRKLRLEVHQRRSPSVGKIMLGPAK